MKVTKVKQYGVLAIAFISICLVSGTMISKDKTSKVTEVKVGITLYDTRDLFITRTQNLIETYINELNQAKNINIVLDVVNGDRNQDIQNEQIDRFIKEAYDIIIVNTVEREDASTIIDKVQAAKIPTIFFNREPVPQDMKKWDGVYYVGSSAMQAGTMQGELLADAIAKDPSIDRNKDGKIQYVMLEGEYGHQDAILRSLYCLKELDDRKISMDNLATDTGMWRKAEGKEKMQQWIEIFGNQIEVVIANNDEMALGAIEALKDKGYMEKDYRIPIIGVDGIDGAIEEIENGVMLGTVFNNSYEQAECIVSKVYELIKGEPPFPVQTQEKENYFIVDHMKITKDNVNIVKIHN